MRRLFMRTIEQAYLVKRCKHVRNMTPPIPERNTLHERRFTAHAAD
jgi:hypothetical protein